MQKAALALAGFTNGASFEMHEKATEFAKQRVQFGRPIGQMQTIQGYLAQMIMEILGSDTLPGLSPSAPRVSNPDRTQNSGTPGCLLSAASP